MAKQTRTPMTRSGNKKPTTTTKTNTTKKK